jgi:hypothetical protein
MLKKDEKKVNVVRGKRGDEKNECVSEGDGGE